MHGVTHNVRNLLCTFLRRDVTWKIHFYTGSHLNSCNRLPVIRVTLFDFRFNIVFKPLFFQRFSDNMAEKTKEETWNASYASLN